MGWRTTSVLMMSGLGLSAVTFGSGLVDLSAARDTFDQVSGLTRVVGQLQAAQGTGSADLQGLLANGAPHAAESPTAALNALLGGPTPQPSTPPPPRSRLTATMRTGSGWLAVIDGTPTRVGSATHDGRLIEAGPDYALLQTHDGSTRRLELGG